ncbi:MAG: PLP-dependent aminotransferase family protein [Candidatus Eisenbacteria bacterium]
MTEIRIDRTRELPLYRQIVKSISNNINNNIIHNGARLPSMRDLAERLGVNRNTVSLAYRELEKIGLVQSDVGRGTFVIGPRSATPGSSASRARGDGGYEWDRMVARRAVGRGDVLDRITRGDGVLRIELTGMVPDRKLFPVEEFQRVLAEIVTDVGPSVLDYGTREGYPPLRRWLSERLSARGAPVPEEEIFILNGAQPGLDLVGRLLLEEGDTVAVESPTYYNAIGAFRLYGAELAPVPLDGEGLRLEALEETFDRQPVKLLYCMPTFQNPTGVTMGRSRREGVLDLARRRGVALLEDTFDAELRYRGEEEVSLRGLPGGGDVLQLGTFSKILFPGLRLGWLAAPPALHRAIARIRRCTDLTAGLLVQAAIHRFCELGHLDRHIEKVRAENRKRLRVLLDSMAEHFPGEVSWTRPDGGMSLWVTMPRGVDAVELLLEVRAEGVNFSPGPLFHVDGGGSDSFRLSFTLEGQERIAEGVRIIARIMEKKIAGPKGARSGAPSVIL